jgi:hypothetical protein
MFGMFQLKRFCAFRIAPRSETLRMARKTRKRNRSRGCSSKARGSLVETSRAEAGKGEMHVESVMVRQVDASDTTGGDQHLDRVSELETQVVRQLHVKIARERQDLAHKQAELEEQVIHHQRESLQQQGGGPRSRRWLAQLGLNES